MKARRHFFRAPHIFGTTLRYGIPVFMGFTVLDAHGGDILRGGGARANKSARAAAGAPTPAATDAARANAKDTLARTTRTLTAMRAMQNSARDAAIRNGSNHLTAGPGVKLPAVPNGIALGGLNPTADPAKWTGADPAIQKIKGGKTQVTVTQTAQQALLEWQTLNVGKKTTLTFDQSKGGANSSQWIAFNKITDPSENPTQILGKIKAQGQVYIINPNGILFGGGSQVNVHALTASALPINENLIRLGLLNNPDQQFLFSSIALPPGNDGTPAFDPALPADTRIGDVTVQAGAVISSPTSAAKTGGRVTLVGANVSNKGTIKTPDGQTILAAGLQVGFEAHSTSDPSLRGLDTFVGAIADPASTLEPYAGTATNLGIIDAARANVTLTGKSVRQLGAIESSTSVSLNGRIDLNASYDAVGNIAFNASNSSFGPAFLNRSTGTVEIGAGSITRILPETASKEKIIGTTLALRSQVNLTGGSIHFGNDAKLYAPSAAVTGRAGTWLTVPSSNASSPPIVTFARAGGRIDVDSGAVIDVSGSTGVTASVAANIVEAQLRGAELADSPVQRDGKLRGQTIFVDITKTGGINGKIWVGTPLADVSGYANLVQRTVGELTSRGGTVDFSAGDTVVIGKGSLIDVSGGSVDYQGAMVRTSRVREGRNIIDIADATPDRLYDGIFNGDFTVSSAKWGTEKTFSHALVPDGYRYQAGYTLGGDGGSLKLSAGAIALDGKTRGQTISGTRQRDISPTASLLNLSFTSERIVGGQIDSYSPHAPLVSFAKSPVVVAVPLPAGRLTGVTLASSILSDKSFGSLRIYNPDGEIVVPESVKLITAPRGSVDFGSANISVDGGVVALGGALTFTTYNLPPLDTVVTDTLPAPLDGRGNFHLGSAAVLSAAGAIVDDRAESHPSLTNPTVVTGGAITIRSFSANLDAGGLVNVSGGVLVSGSGGAAYGNAGSVSILTGMDSTLKSVTGGGFSLASDLRGFSGSKGGTVTLGALDVSLGGSPDAAALVLGSEFFNGGGFANFDISGIGRQAAGASAPTPGLVVARGARIEPEVRSTILGGMESGGNLRLTTILKPEGIRNAASLTLGATGTRNDINGLLLVRGDLMVEKGAHLGAGAAGSITLKGDTVSVLGNLSASGGTIRITGAGKLPFNGIPTRPASTVWLASSATIDASGTTLLVPDAFGRRRGAVLDGGTIIVTGNIIADAGAKLDVSGTRGSLDLLTGESGRSLADLATGSAGTTRRPVPLETYRTSLASDGGIIRLAGGEMLVTDAGLAGSAGGSGASGGTLQIASGRFYEDALLSNPFDPALLVRDGGTARPAGLAGGVAVTFADDGTGIAGGGRFTADDFAAGGFSNLYLEGVVKFTGDVAISARGSITAGTGPALFADGAVKLDASRVGLGTAFQKPVLPEVAANFGFVDGNNRPVSLAPVFGLSKFSAHADLIDVGYVSLQGIGRAELDATGGDIRGSGTLEIAGRLGLKAAQIYPPTGLEFTLAAFDYVKGGVAKDGLVTISNGGMSHLPLSAGGTLSIYASDIRQDGTLRAPLGAIHLGADTPPHDVLSGLDFAAGKSITLGAGSVTSVSAIDPLTGKGVTIPYGLSLDGETWLDPRGVNITAGGAPQKRITLSAASVTTSEGSDIDIRGGGDLLAYRWVNGQGGTSDILASTGSFAVIPDFNAAFAPYAPFNGSKTNGDPGYANASLTVGQQVKLNGGGGLPAGNYTLLPARYALLPGAFLVTPLAGPAIGTVAKIDGSSIVSGYGFQGLESGGKPSGVATRFEVAAASVIARRAEYTRLTGNTFFKPAGALRLPGDAGQLVLSATNAMRVEGEIRSSAAEGFLSGLIDISSPADIYITDGKSAVPDGVLSLDASLLSDFGAESLLIGGVRTSTGEGTEIEVSTRKLVVNNPDAVLSGSEIILVAKDRIGIAAGSRITRTKSGGSGSGTLLLGNDSEAGSGNGVLARIGAGSGVTVVRKNFTPGSSGLLSVGRGAIVSAGNLILDSTSRTAISSGARLDTDSLSLSSGKISLALEPGLDPGADPGLVLSASTLASLGDIGSLSLTSYSTIDAFGAGSVGGLGTGGKPRIGSLTLSAAAIRNAGNTTGTVDFLAREIHLDNRTGAVAPAAPSGLRGSLEFSGGQILLGAGAIALDGFAGVNLRATSAVQTTAGGSITSRGDLALLTPLVYSSLPADYGISALGRLIASGKGGDVEIPANAGLGSQLALSGSSVSLDTRFNLAGGRLSATSTGGDLTVGGMLETAGVTRRFGGAVRHVDGGIIELGALHGDIVLESGGLLDVSAPGGGNAGTASFSAPDGTISLTGHLKGSAEDGGRSGNVLFDVGKLANTAAADILLNKAGFGNRRIFRVRGGDVEIDGFAAASDYQLTADSGKVLLSGTLDVSGKTGGSVRLVSSGGLRIAETAEIDVSAADFDSAGKGGSVSLEANSGRLLLDAGSRIDLGVDAAGGLGKFTGTLHLRASRDGTDVTIGPIGSTIRGASNIIVEGFKTYTLTGANASISTALKDTIYSEATSFIGNAVAEATREDRLLADLGGSGGAIGKILTVRPGVEISNPNGNLTLGGATTSGASGDWNLSGFRFGADLVPGILTLRAGGDLVFYNSLSDGFTNATYRSELLARNTALTDNAQSWSFRLAAGADFSSADSLTVKSGAATGSVLLGKNGFSAIVTGGNNAQTSTPLSSTSATGLFQVIRTGSGDISVRAARDIQLLNQFATIYTAGTLVGDPSLGGKFDTPVPFIGGNLASGALGAVQQSPASAVQYTLGGGNVSLSAGNDIIHLTKNSRGEVIADSERQMPINWLYRRGYVDPVTGDFGISNSGETASTTWWVDFTNFFEGVGALGGGNVSLDAARDISNVDAAIPTNSRMPSGKPDASSLVELGGGDLAVRAGRNIDGGVYYVERGNGALDAGAAIVTNSTRSPSLNILSNPSRLLDPSVWLPTALFLGKGNFDVQAAGDVLLGPVVNPFLLPSGYNNTFWYKSYFSTYAADSGVDISSLGGNVTLRQSIAYEPGRATTDSSSVLKRWFTGELLLSNSSASYLQPWLRLSESSVDPFDTAFSILPPTLRATAISGNLALQGDFNLFPSGSGQVELVASGSILGLNPAGYSTSGNSNFTLWADTRINLSDANPASVPGIANPFAYQTISGTSASASRVSRANFLLPLDNLFAETGSTNGVLQQKQTLHAAGLLHAGDKTPSLLYAGTGDIDGLTLFSAEAAKVIAGQDIRDVSLYLQNVSSSDVSVVSAGRDIIAYDSGTASRVASGAAGNLIATGDGLEAGDIQIAGPGALEVFAGRNLDLGIGGNNADGTGSGITSIGNGRNPALPFGGASVVAGAGIGTATSLSDSRPDFESFIGKFVLAGDGGRHLKELGLTADDFKSLGEESRDRTALEVFFLVLRDAGRDHNNPDEDGFGNYDAGKRAVKALFPQKKGEVTWDGDILTRARDIRTRSGGDISLFVPGGGLQLATTVIGQPLAPPGIITESGGNISVFADQSVDLGISRIFTLRGGDEIIWSSRGDIAAGSSSKTVQSAPPTRVLIDPQSADVQTDLAGLATGGGIGVLTTVAGVNPSDVDLIAPSGTIDAGDAGIRVSGNLNISAAVVVNAGNISVGGNSASSAPSAPSSPSVGSVSAAANTAAAATAGAPEPPRQNTAPPPAVDQQLSLITVEVIGYGGGGSGDDEDKDKDEDQENQ